ncbi:PREDICTED: caspase-8-like [Branchiostoma belcheri]|uniref:Caspase-8-like n=1 Tax=Branchiostoma belcheri TaxID=7741 RepID=A0A6P4ZTC9_BRABE|nr:PREDICTED: caspase-8-like [Branchiostoma belcheri]
MLVLISDDGANRDDSDEGRVADYILGTGATGTCIRDVSRAQGTGPHLQQHQLQKNHTPRTGAEKDTERLRGLFEGLKFDVRCYKNMTYQDMMTTLEQAGEEDHSNFDCFVCCVMSHGAQGKVFSSDEYPIEISLLLKPFNAKECPSLVGKPKLFFIQACQGVHVQERVPVDCAFDANAVLHVSQEADFFVGLPTVPGCVARRDDDGAPYIYHLTNVFKEFGDTYDLLTMMTMVANKMDQRGVSSNHSTLRKSVYFNP